MQNLNQEPEFYFQFAPRLRTETCVQGNVTACMAGVTPGQVSVAATSVTTGQTARTRVQRAGSDRAVTTPAHATTMPPVMPSAAVARALRGSTARCAI